MHSVLCWACYYSLKERTFKDFTESDEAIATNIISAKRKLLEEVGIIIKTQRPDNKKTNLYLLTDKGLALTPVLTELALWSDNNLRDVHPTIQNGEGMEFLRKDKAAFASVLEKNTGKNWLQDRFKMAGNLVLSQ